MKKLWLTIIALTAVVLTAVFVYQKFFEEEQRKETVVEAAIVSSSSSIVLPQSQEKQKQQKNIVGLIVPHFAPVNHLTIDALSYVTTSPDLIILIGPNHFERGTTPITTGIYQNTNLKQQTNFALEAMNELTKSGVGAREDDVISAEHSIGTPLPLIVQKFPRAEVLPIILKYQQSPDKIENLLSSLQNISSKNTLIVASIDFSHYLSSEIAPQKDAKTEKYIDARDYKKIAILSNDYIDSPWGLIIFLKYLEQNGITYGKQLAHTNTGQIAGQTIESSTSFFTYIYATSTN